MKPDLNISINPPKIRAAKFSRSYEIMEKQLYWFLMNENTSHHVRNFTTIIFFFFLRRLDCSVLQNVVLLI